MKKCNEHWQWLISVLICTPANTIIDTKKCWAPMCVYARTSLGGLDIRKIIWKSNDSNHSKPGDDFFLLAFGYLNISYNPGGKNMKLTVPVHYLETLVSHCLLRLPQALRSLFFWLMSFVGRIVVQNGVCWGRKCYVMLYYVWIIWCAMIWLSFWRNTYL